MNKKKLSVEKLFIISILVLLIILLIIFNQTINEMPKYPRQDYKHWIDQDHDCQNTRQEVLIAQSIIPVQLNFKGCKVVEGKWFDPYTNQYFTDPEELDIDHFIPLKEVHLSGGYQWSKIKKQQYANDLKNPYTLIAVSRKANRSKGDKDIANWLPSNQEFFCEYLSRWILLKKQWQLSIDKNEEIFINQNLKRCQNN